MTEITVKRVYEQPEKQDGARVLVDRMWPRGMRKDQLEMDAWYKEIAPSAELRKWFNHDSDRWAVFRERYLRELAENKDIAERILQEQKGRKITLLYSARNESYNHALVLREYLQNLERH